MRYTVYCRVWVGEKARESEEKEGRGREKILYQRRGRREKAGEKKIGGRERDRVWMDLPRPKLIRI